MRRRLRKFSGQLIVALLLVGAVITTCGAAPVNGSGTAASTEMRIYVSPQARIVIDSQGEILSIHHVGDLTGSVPKILHVYSQAGSHVPLTRSVRAALQKLAPHVNWAMNGLIYQRAPDFVPLTLPGKPRG